MWVWRTWPLENRISRCLPFASTATTVAPTTCWMGMPGSRTRTSVTSRPANHFRRFVAVRKMVSPSGVAHHPLGARDETGRLQRAAQLVGEALESQTLEPPRAQQTVEGG